MQKYGQRPSHEISLIGECFRVFSVLFSTTVLRDCIYNQSPAPPKRKRRKTGREGGQRGVGMDEGMEGGKKREGERMEEGWVD